MKGIVFVIATLLPFTVLAQEPTLHPGAPIQRRHKEHGTLRKRAIPGHTTTTLLVYHTCPRVECPGPGMIADSGTPIDIMCYTRDNTSVVNGDAGWAKMADGHWVAMSFGEFISWTSPIPYCIDS
ncbi:hypothetical protein L218DRAFT_958206 [Marasmius fiardii PR-910]|nr:hypothetical protein L218DRAFT_958206 [Marasmius fiardii PR-910]